MNIDKDKCMIVKSKFQDIKEELSRNYNKPQDKMAYCDATPTMNEVVALKKAVDKLLILLDEVVCN